MKYIVCLSLVVFPTFMWAQDGGSTPLFPLLGGTTTEGSGGSDNSFGAELANLGLNGGGLDVKGAVVPGVGDLALGGSISASDTGASSSTDGNSSSGTN